ncbi:MAG: hypothetical protein U0350_35155 [Caldilineaceae bacterium]
MTSTIISPFGKPAPNVPIREGTPPLTRPSKEEIAAFPAEAQALLTNAWTDQKARIDAGQYDLRWLEGRHILLAGATGPGLGGAFASAILGLGTAASVTLVGRDLSKSLNFETGNAMQAKAEAANMGKRFHWLNDGLAMEGAPLEKLLAALREAGADRVVYFNTVAAAISGLLPGMPPVYVRDVDQNGLFQWQLLPLSEKEIEITKFVMGEMAVRFPSVLEANGIAVEASAFADWRGSLDKVGAIWPNADMAGKALTRQPLFCPKKFCKKRRVRLWLQSAFMLKSYFYPMMRTRLPLILA